jgi:hypothetical protein
MRVSDDKLRLGSLEKLIGGFMALGGIGACVSFALWCWGISDQVLLLNNNNATQIRALDKLETQTQQIPVHATKIDGIKDQVNRIEVGQEKTVRYWEDWLKERKQ